ncbi:MAG: hypothetical protein R3E14_11430 [Erythrobacter sp.]
MRIMILASALALSACGSSDEVAITDKDGDEVGTYAMANGETTARIRSEDGTVTAMRSGAQVPVDLPSGFTVAPGLIVLNNTNVERGEGRYVMLTLEGEAPVADVVAFYRKQAEAAGVDVNVEVTTGDSATIAGEGEGGLGFSLMASRSGDKTAVQLTLNQGLD